MSAERTHGNDSNGIVLICWLRFSRISRRVEKKGVLITARLAPGTILRPGAVVIMTIARSHAASSNAADRIALTRDGVRQSSARKMAQDKWEMGKWQMAKWQMAKWQMAKWQMANDNDHWCVAICHLPSVICHPSSAICHPSFCHSSLAPLHEHPMLLPQLKQR